MFRSILPTETLSEVLTPPLERLFSLSLDGSISNYELCLNPNLKIANKYKYNKKHFFT